MRALACCCAAGQPFLRQLDSMSDSNEKKRRAAVAGLAGLSAAALAAVPSADAAQAGNFSLLSCKRSWPLRTRAWLTVKCPVRLIIAAPPFLRAAAAAAEL